MNTERKNNCREYAALIANRCKDQDRITSIRESLGFSSNSQCEKVVKSKASKRMVPRHNKVGIWTANTQDGQTCFVRDEEYKSEYFRWAKNDKIPVKSNKYRIAFLGESVSRGYLFDPYITPASILEKMMNDYIKDREVEVVDLARTGIVLFPLQTLCLESLALQPDMMVVFAGNNWRASLDDLSDEELEELMSAKSQHEMLKKFRAVTEQKTVTWICELIDTLADISENNDIPIVFVIPEFNLKDWRHSVGSELFPLNADKSKQCISLKNEIQEALTMGNYETAQKKSTELIELDSFSALGYEFMARCMLHTGNLEQARKYYEIAKECGLYMVYDVPCCYNFIRDTIVREASKKQIHTINLPELFGEHCDAIPGYDLFIDYCHLSIDGMQLAMKYTAECILRLLNISAIVNLQKTSLDRDVLGKVYFVAAVHNAHNNQPYELVYLLCHNALQLSANVSSLMVSYMDLATRKLPWVLNASIHNIIESDIVAHYPFFVQDSNHKFLDISPVQAIANALQDYHKKNIVNPINTLRISEYSSHNKSVDLLEQYYRNNSYEKNHCFYSYESTPRNSKVPVYLRVKDVDSSFFFIVDANMNVKLKLTMRNICSSRAEIKYKISVNGFTPDEFIVKNQWCNVEFKIDKKHLSADGINKILLIKDDDFCCFNHTRPANLSTRDFIINNLYNAACQIREFTLITD